MAKRIARIVLIGGAAGVLVMALATVWLKVHEDELVFAAARSRRHMPDAAAGKYPYLPVRLAVAVQFNSLARIGDIHIPIVIAHSREDTLIPYSHALKLFAAANEPKHLITFDFPTEDGFGGHVDVLYEHVELLEEALGGLVPAMPPPRKL
jgi:pimeloyl-ACP methyl ester carboxylesterase